MNINLGSPGIRELAVAVILATGGAALHAAWTAYVVEQAFAQHTADASIHRPPGSVEQKLIDQQRQLDRHQRQLEHIEEQNNEILSGLGRLEGKLDNIKPEDTR